MFDPKSYRNACGRMILDAGKIEEMITMTEHTSSKFVGRPARVVLVAAALVAALGITASAAEIPAVREFFTSMFITVSVKDDPALGLSLPSVAVEERDGRRILLVNEDEVDVTDALAQKGEYLYEGDGFQVVVDKNGEAVVTSYGADGMTVTYSTEAGTESGVVYHVADEGEVGYDDYNVSVDVVGANAREMADPDAMGTYNIVTDETGALCVSPVTEK